MNHVDFDIKFIKIKDHKLDVEKILVEIDKKVIILYDIYLSYIQQGKNDDNTIISLDSLNFQRKFISIERDNYISLHKLFLNRIYGQYYKLYKNLAEFVTPYITSYNLNITIDNSYMVYKDLETYTEYDFSLIEKIYTNILSILDVLYKYSLQEEHKIYKDEIKTKNGININNFVYQKKYSLHMMEENINLYYKIIHNYLEFQTKYFTRLILKLKLLYSQISADINLETDISVDDYSLESDTEEHIEMEINTSPPPSGITNWKIVRENLSNLKKQSTITNDPIPTMRPPPGMMNWKIVREKLSIIKKHIIIEDLIPTIRPYKKYIYSGIICFLTTVFYNL